MNDYIKIILGILFACSMAVLVGWSIIKGILDKRNFKKKLEEVRSKREKAIEDEHVRFVEDMKELSNKYGPITRAISYELYDSNLNKHYEDIVIYEKAKKIIFGKTEYNFEDIFSCSIYDENKKDIPPSQVTRTDTGSMLGRAAVGGLTLGVVGAVIGAMTAKTESISSSSSFDFNASYVLKIGVKSLDNPLITLKFGYNKSKAEEVYSLIQAIIAMK